MDPMSTVTKYLLYGPKDVLKRLPGQLLQAHPPKFSFRHHSTTGDDQVYVYLYEEYEKQTHTTVSLVCVAEYTPSHARVHLKKAGGRMGFKGSSLREEKTIESGVIEYIIDFATRYGLSLQNDPSGDDDRDD